MTDTDTNTTNMEAVTATTECSDAMPDAFAVK
jgi:hypothetical protein